MILKNKPAYFLILGLCLLLISFSSHFFTSQTFSQTKTYEEQLQTGDLLKRGDYLYALTWGDLIVYDVSNSSEPQELSRSGDHLSPMYLLDDYLLIQSNTGLKIFDITSPETPQLIFSDPDINGDPYFIGNNVWAGYGLASITLGPDPSVLQIPYDFAPPPEAQSVSLAQQFENLILLNYSKTDFCVGFGCSTSHVDDYIVDISDPMDLKVIAKASNYGEDAIIRINRENEIFVYVPNESDSYDLSIYEYIKNEPLALKFQTNSNQVFPPSRTANLVFSTGADDESQYGWYQYSEPFRPPEFKYSWMNVFASSISGFVDNENDYVFTKKDIRESGDYLSAIYSIREFPTMCKTDMEEIDGRFKTDFISSNYVYIVHDVGELAYLSIFEIENKTLFKHLSTSSLLNNNGNAGVEIREGGNDNIYISFGSIFLDIDISNLRNPAFNSYTLAADLPEHQQAHAQETIDSINVQKISPINFENVLFNPIHFSNASVLFENNFEEIDSQTVINSPTTQYPFIYNCDADTEGGSCPVQVDTGINGKAAYFDGLNDSIAMNNPDPLINLASPFSISVWVKPESTGGLRNIVSRGHHLTPEHEIIFRIQDGIYEFGLWDGDNNDALTSFPIPESNLTEWGHLAGVFTGSVWNLYFNGELVSSTADNADQMTCSFASWALGSSGNSLERFYQGYMDEVQFYEGALSAREVKEIFENR